MSCFFIRRYTHTEFHENRPKIRHSCHTKSRIFAMLTAESVVRFCPFTIPAYSSSKRTFWFLFHQNRSRFTQVIVYTNFWYRVQGTAYSVQINNDPPWNRLKRVLGPSKHVKKRFWRKFFFWPTFWPFRFFIFMKAEKWNSEKQRKYKKFIVYSISFAVNEKFVEIFILIVS